MHCFAWLADDGIAADRTVSGDRISGASVGVGLHGLHYVGDYLASALQEHPVPDSKVLSADVVLVVQGCHLYHCTVDLYGREDGVGIEAACAADINADV